MSQRNYLISKAEVAVMTAVQSDTSRFDRQRTVEEIYRRLGTLSEEERRAVLKMPNKQKNMKTMSRTRFL